MKTFALCVVVALITAACTSGSDAPSPMSEVTVAKSDTNSKSYRDSVAQVKRLTESFARLVHEDSLADGSPERIAREAKLGLNTARVGSGRSFCERFNRTLDWDDLVRNYDAHPSGSFPGLSLRRADLQAHFVSNVKELAGMLLSQEGSFSKEFGDNPYIYSNCGGGLLEVMDKVLTWVVDSGIDSDSVGLTSKAVRAKAAVILAEEIRGETRKGGKGILVCKCESTIPFYFDKFKFTQKELGLSNKEWADAHGEFTLQG